VGVLQKDLGLIRLSDGPPPDSIIRQEQAVAGDVRDGAYGEHVAKEQLGWHRDK
jgi:hypothetical protein